LAVCAARSAAVPSISFVHSTQYLQSTNKMKQQRVREKAKLLVLDNSSPAKYKGEESMKEFVRMVQYTNT
jgi:hypothetical protein